VELQRICVDDDEPVAALAIEHLIPPRDVSLDPESRGGIDIGRDGGVIRERFQQCVRAAVLSAPGRLSGARRPLDDDDHARNFTFGTRACS